MVHWGGRKRQNATWHALAKKTPLVLNVHFTLFEDSATLGELNVHFTLFEDSQPGSEVPRFGQR